MVIANPDLVRRMQTGAPLATPDKTTFYGGDEHGYTDYPALAARAAMGSPRRMSGDGPPPVA